MNDKWEEVARRGSNQAVLVTEATALGIVSGKFADFFDNEINLTSYRHSGSARSFYKSDLENVTDFLQKKEKESPGYLKNMGQKLVDLYERERQWVDENALNEYGNFSNEELAELFKQYYERTFYVPLGYMYIFANRFLPGPINQEIMDKVSDFKKQAEYVSVLLALDENTEIKAEKSSLRRIAELIKKGKTFNDGQVVSMIEDHLRNFKHLSRYYYFGNDSTAEDVKNRVRELLEKGDDNGESLTSEEIRLKTEENIKKLDLSAETVERIYAVKSLGKASNVFEENYFYYISKFVPLLDEIAHRLDLSRDQLVMGSRVEIVSALNKNDSEKLREKARLREKGYAVILENGNIEILEGEKYEKYKDQEVVDEEIALQNDSLKGQAASPGVVKGEVKLLFDPKEMGKVKKGDIIVAPATYPSLVPAMERAGGIVTEEGGLLSHAAIVSRELGIPCVVGVKKITKILKDGDMVEVDAEKGIVRKVSKE